MDSYQLSWLSIPVSALNGVDTSTGKAEGMALKSAPPVISEKTGKSFQSYQRGRLAKNLY